VCEQLDKNKKQPKSSPQASNFEIWKFNETIEQSSSTRSNFAPQLTLSFYNWQQQGLGVQDVLASNA
jgi:hypothetical protein